MALNCCVYLDSSSVWSWSSLMASAFGYCIAAFLVARARFFKRLQNRLLLWRMSFRVSLPWVSWQRESTNFCPTIMINLLWDMKISGGWLLLRLLVNTSIALCSAAKHSLQCSERGIFFAESGLLWITACFADGKTWENVKKDRLSTSIVSLLALPYILHGSSLTGSCLS